MSERKKMKKIRKLSILGEIKKKKMNFILDIKTLPM